MRSSLVLVVLLLAVTALAEWKPPENPDPTKILREAQDDTKAERYEDALAKFVWYHENALKHNIGQGGVRLSFALSAWNELNAVYPPALTKMTSIRDATEQKVREGNASMVTFGAFQDVSSLNKHLDQERRTADLFAWLDGNKEQIAKRVYPVAQPALVSGKQYRLCGKYLDPDRDFEQMKQGYELNLKFVQKRGLDLGDFAYKSFSNKAATLVALLVINERYEEANEIATKAAGVLNDAKFHKELEKAKGGSVPDPWP